MQALVRAGITKAQLHDRTGIARSTIDKWKTAPKPPQIPTVLAVADALGLDRDEAVRLAGIVKDVAVPERDGVPVLSEVSTDDLLRELRRRIPD